MLSQQKYLIVNRIGLHGGKEFVWVDLNKVDHIDEIELDFLNIQDDDLNLFGWIVEEKYTRYPDSNWRQHSNYKVYHSKESAMNAINQSPYSSNYNHRVSPVYKASKNYFRNIAIKKILS